MNSLTTHYRRSQLIALPVPGGKAKVEYCYAVNVLGDREIVMGTKAHDLFVLPLCRKHHDELHADTVAFEERYGSQLELIFRFIDRALATGVLA